MSSTTTGKAAKVVGTLTGERQNLLKKAENLDYKTAEATFERGISVTKRASKFRKFWRCCCPCCYKCLLKNAI